MFLWLLITLLFPTHTHRKRWAISWQTDARILSLSKCLFDLHSSLFLFVCVLCCYTCSSEAADLWPLTSDQIKHKLIEAVRSVRHLCRSNLKSVRTGSFWCHQWTSQCGDVFSWSVFFCVFRTTNWRKSPGGSPSSSQRKDSSVSERLNYSRQTDTPADIGWVL